MTRMKYLFWLLIGIGMLGGESHVVLVQHDLGANITSFQNESVLINDSKGEVAPFGVSVLTISDRRCPSDVVCIWAGQASVDFRIEGSSFQLLIGQSKEF